MEQTIDEIKQIFGSKLFEFKRDSFILKWALLHGKYDILNIFEKEAWTDDNIKYFLKLDMQIPKGLFSNSAVLKHLLKEKNFKYNNSFSDEAWDDENKVLVLKLIDENVIRKIPKGLIENSDFLKEILDRGYYDLVKDFNGKTGYSVNSVEDIESLKMKKI